MKKGLLISLLVLVLLIFVGVSTVVASSSCPPWLVITGICLTDQPGVQVENIVDAPGHYLRVNYDWMPDRSLVSAAVTVPDLSVLLGFNLNKFRLEIASVYLDTRPGYNNLYFIGHLVCDPQGSLQPTIAFSIPRLSTPPNSTYFGIDNWKEATTSPCSY